MRKIDGELSMKINGEFILREVAGEKVLIPVGETALKFSGVCIVNPTGTDIWEMLSAGANKEQIINKMSETYEVSRVELAKDVEEFLTTLKKADILID